MTEVRTAGDGPPLVTVVGSLHYDIMVASTDRPRKGETVTGSAWWPKFGGKGGNQAVAAAQAGARTAMIGAVGDDDPGRSMLACLTAEGVDARHVRVERGMRSGMSVAIFDSSGDYGAVIVSGANQTLSARDADAARDVLAASRVLMLQSEIPEPANVAAATIVHTHGGLVILNAAPARPLGSELRALVDLLIVNEIEAGALVPGAAVSGLASAGEAALALTQSFPAVIVTAGGAGLAYADRNGLRLRVPGLSVTVESTHGAGDMFVGSLAAAIARGVAMAEALDLANRAAARLVATPESDRRPRLG